MPLASLTISCLAHAGIILWAFLVMSTAQELKPPAPEPIAVAMITPSEFLRLKKGSETATQLEAKAKEEPKPEQSRLEAEKPKPVTAPIPPAEPPSPPEKTEPKPPEETKAEPPKPDPIAEKLAALPPEKPDEAQKLAEEKKKFEEMKKAAEEQRKAEEAKKKAEEEKKKAEDKKKADEKKKAEEKKKLAEKKRKEEEQKKKQQAADRLAALLDKDPTKKGAPNSADPPATETDYTGPTAGAREGNDTVLSAREQDLLKGQISQQLRACWKLPGGGGGIETTVVTLRWMLLPDGTLDGEPRIERPQSGPVFQIAAEAAMRAVKLCSPFQLPPDKYDAWRLIIWDFDPREML